MLLPLRVNTFEPALVKPAEPVRALVIINALAPVDILPAVVPIAIVPPLSVIEADWPEAVKVAALTVPLTVMVPVPRPNEATPVPKFRESAVVVATLPVGTVNPLESVLHRLADADHVPPAAPKPDVAPLLSQ